MPKRLDMRAEETSPRHASTPVPHPVTEADFLAAINTEPTTAEEIAAAYDGHTRECIASGECACNPFALGGYMRPLSAGERAPWPHWRSTLAHERFLDAQRAA